MNETSSIRIADTTANPAPLGLFGFGMTTILLNLHNAGVYEMNSMILAMGIFYGGLAQIFAGLLEWKKNNTFGMTAFTSYGAFWLSLVVIILLPNATPAMKTDAIAMGWYLLIWGLFTLGLFVGTFRLSVALRLVFGSLVILFFMLAIGDFAKLPATAPFKLLTGYEGIFCGASAFYTGIAQVLNEIYGRGVLPLGTPKPRA